MVSADGAPSRSGDLQTECGGLGTHANTPTRGLSGVEKMWVGFVLAASILLQLTAAVLAVRLIRVTGAGRAWTLIALAVFLMAVRRGITLYRLASGDLAHPPDLPAELLSLGVSALMVLGVAGIAPLFVTHPAGEGHAEAVRTTNWIGASHGGLRNWLRRNGVWRRTWRNASGRNASFPKSRPGSSRKWGRSCMTGSGNSCLVCG